MSLVRIRVIDSHTEGEPTRVGGAGGPDLGDGPLTDRRERFRDRHAVADRNGEVRIEHAGVERPVRRVRTGCERAEDVKCLRDLERGLLERRERERCPLRTANRWPAVECECSKVGDFLKEVTEEDSFLEELLLDGLRDERLCKIRRECNAGILEE